MDVIIPRTLDLEAEVTTVLEHVDHYYHQLLISSGYARETPPLAELLRAVHGLDGSWLVVSPISWEASHNDAKLVAVGDDLALSHEESLAWFEVFSEFVKDEFIATHYHDSATWLIRVDQHPPINAKPVHLLRHHSLQPQLASLDDTMFWQRFLTEIQMLFSQHVLNRVRKTPYVVNGIWIWGNGALRAPDQRMMVIDNEANQLLASVLSHNVHWFDQNTKYPDSALLLIEDPSNVVVLQANIKNQTMQWFWNNTAYQTKALTGLKRWWNVLC